MSDKKILSGQISTKINPQVEAYRTGHSWTSDNVSTLTPTGIALRVRIKASHRVINKPHSATQELAKYLIPIKF